MKKVFMSAAIVAIMAAAVSCECCNSKKEAEAPAEEAVEAVEEAAEEAQEACEAAAEECAEAVEAPAAE